MPNKFNWRICPSCGFPFIPHFEKQRICSPWCEERNKRSMDDEKYIAEQLAAINLEWQKKYINDIPSNGVECWWTVGELDTLKRFYKIVPFHEHDERGLVTSIEPKYFCLYEALGVESDKASLIAIYESLEAAQNRAKFQLLAIVNIIQRYCQH